MKQIVLCADDYGLNRSISGGIVNLIRHRRLSATSCLVTSKFFKDHASWLKPYRTQADVGLHFNLTEGCSSKPLKSLTRGVRFISLPKLLIKSHCRLLSYSTLIEELERQLDLFETALHGPPDFIDGHQHIHQFPQIRDALIEIYLKHFSNSKVYIRCAADLLVQSPDYLKKWVISSSGALPFKQRLQTLQIPHNSTFSGIYNFKKASHYGQYFQRFLAESADGGLIMCHPGLDQVEPSDTLKTSRKLELRYFNSEEFDRHLAEAEVKLSRLWSS